MLVKGSSPRTAGSRHRAKQIQVGAKQRELQGRFLCEEHATDQLPNILSVLKKRFTVLCDSFRKLSPNKERKRKRKKRPFMNSRETQKL